MLLVFFFLPLTGIYFSILVSRQYDILDEGIQFPSVVTAVFTGSRHEYVSPRGRLHLSKICLDSASLTENSYLLLISPNCS